MVFPVVHLTKLLYHIISAINAKPKCQYTAILTGVNCLAEDRLRPALLLVSGMCQATHRTASHAGGRWAVINENLLNSDM